MFHSGCGQALTAHEPLFQLAVRVDRPRAVAAVLRACDGGGARPPPRAVHALLEEAAGGSAAPEVFAAIAREPTLLAAVDSRFGTALLAALREPPRDGGARRLLLTAALSYVTACGDEPRGDFVGALATLPAALLSEAACHGGAAPACGAAVLLAAAAAGSTRLAETLLLATTAVDERARARRRPCATCAPAYATLALGLRAAHAPAFVGCRRAVEGLVLSVFAGVPSRALLDAIDALLAAPGARAAFRAAGLPGFASKMLRAPAVPPALAARLRAYAAVVPAEPCEEAGGAESLCL